MRIKSKFLFFSILSLVLIYFSTAEATSYNNNLIYYAAKQRNKVRRAYHAPADDQIRIFKEAVNHVLHSQFAAAIKSASSIGYTLKSIAHTNGSTYYSLESTDTKHRAWGTYIFYLGDDKKNYLIEVPHPVEEKNTTNIGINTFIDGDAVAFLLSGTYKKSEDVTLDAKSIFQAVHEEVISVQGFTVTLQIHGFSRKAYPQIILTSGTPIAISEMDALTNEFLMNNFTVGIYDGTQYSDYGATQNEQAKYTNSTGSSFVGIYLNQAVHNSQEKGNLVINSIDEYTSGESPQL